MHAKPQYAPSLVHHLLMDRPPYTYPAVTPFSSASQYGDPSLTLYSVSSSFPLINAPPPTPSMDGQPNYGSHAPKRPRVGNSVRLETSFVDVPRATYTTLQAASFAIAPGPRSCSTDTGSSLSLQTAEFQLEPANKSSDKSSDKSSKKRHPCWMCHKRFDRPSTLKKVSISSETY